MRKVRCEDTNLRYRSDIDGLRAIAVLPVILFHLQAPFVTGGYTGVDIFFVISGFLITKIIADEIDKNSYSLLRFYERRIRRIVPALFFMLATVSIIASITLIPNYYTEFTVSAASSALSISNLFFYRHSGYFAFGSEVVPLLHTWSLGVEEQFYILFPLIFLLGRRILKLSWSWIIFPLFLFSLLFGVMQTYFSTGIPGINQDGGFYLPISRSWEFLVGSVLAVGIIRVPSSNKLLMEISAFVGVCLILISFFVFDGQTKFPGCAALVPCFGSALIIYANGNTKTTLATFLSWRPLVWTGLISYSLYLWHWPMIVFMRLIWGSEHSLLIYALLFASMFPIAWFSWRFVELPVRQNKQLIGRRTLFACAGAGALALTVLAGFARTTGGLPTRFPPNALAIANAGTFDWLGDCDNKSGAQIAEGSVCTIGPASVPITFALIGDSFANALSPAVEAAANKAEERGLALTRGGCYPLVGIVSNTECKDFLDAAIARVKATTSVKTVILIARWTAAFEGSRFGAIRLKGLFINDLESKERSYEENKAVFARSIRRTMDALSAYNIYLVGFIPEQAANVPQVAALRAKFGAQEFAIPRRVVDERQANVRKFLESAAQVYKFHLLDAMPALCDDRKCLGVENGISLYSDDNHLSRFGALKELPLLSTVFTEVKSMRFGAISQGTGSQE